MRHSKKIRGLSLLLAVLMIIGLLPMNILTAQAAATDFDTSVSDGYYNVISSDTYNLAPGAVEKEIILNNASGTDRKVVHVFEVDATNESIEVLPGYYGIDKLNPDDLAGDSAIWQAKELTKTVAYYENTLGYNVVGAMNTALAYDSNAPYGYMVWEGVVLGTPEIHKGAQTYLAIYKDGSAELRSMSTPLDGNEWTAISANFGWLVKDGVLQSKTVERTSSDASRSMIGIKEDGTLVFCQVDGRNAPTSTGLSNYEMGEMMLSLGCVNAVNCDGGGSSTFVSKREGTTENVMRSIPSDGSERPTINSVIIVSKAAATGIFDHAVVESGYDYVAPGASMTLTASGVDAGGYPADVPADAVWQLSDASMGTVENGLFTAGQTLGDVTAQLVYNGAVVGEKLLHVVHPDKFGFNTESTVIPYGKSVELVVEASYGVDSWAVCIEGVYELTLSDETAATLEGNVITATSDESVAGVDVTATYLPDTTKTDVLAVSYGKGSEILFDFEDGEEQFFLGVDEMYDWATENGATAPIQNDGNYSEDGDSQTFLSNAANGGKVKKGENALGVTLDYTDAQFASWSYNMFFYTGEPYVLRDVANGQNATAFGAWVYIPEGAAGVAMQLGVYTKGDTGALGFTQLNFQVMTLSGAYKNMNAITEADIPESRWVYARADLTGKDYYTLADPMGKLSREPSFMRYYVKPMQPANLTFYFDDFTLDYSDAVEDRVLPTISDVNYSTADTSVALEQGAVIGGSTISFSAKVADNAGLNSATGAILVDGVSVNATVAGSVLSCGDVKLNPGVHTVTFLIEDTLGNLAKVTRTFTISGDAAVTLSGHNDSGAAAEYDSVYYADINVADIAAVDTLTATVYLQTANTWEPQGIEVAEGFEATYSLNEVASELTVTVKRIGEPALTGAQTLVSLPIRVWSWNGVNHVTDAAVAPETQFKTGNCPIVTIQARVVYGAVTYVEDPEALNPFGGSISVATNLNDNVNPWHYHDAELTVLNKEATCTVAGYENRTYCETCQSVIDWGTVIPATGHTYEIVDEHLVCACGDTVTGNGIVSANGMLYYLIADKLVTGWQAVGTGWCYADPATYEVATGEYIVSGLTYTFGEDGVLVKGVWITDENGTMYSYGPGCYTRVWKNIDGADYYFGTDSYMYTGIRSIPVNRNNPNEGTKWYDFGTDGKLCYDFADYDGIVDSEVEGKFYVKAGMSYYAGLFMLDGDYYYARTSGEIVVNRTYWVSKTNDLLPAAQYTFGADGKMINPPATEEPDPEVPTDPTDPSEPVEPEVKNGIVEEDGKLWWYVDGVKTYGGLMLIDGDYYYARTSGEIVVNRTYWVTKTNDLLPAAQYTFGADGKMIDPPATEEPDPEVPTEPTEPEVPTDPVEPEVKNGIVKEDGKLWWYVDGVKTYGGLMLIDGDYYYARTSGEIVVNRTYWVTKTNDLLPAAQYTFGADGKMLNPPATEEPNPEVPTEPTEPEVPTDPVEPEVKNGIVEEDGKLWWYVDGVKTYGGLMLIDGDYYYARTSGEIVCGRGYWISKTNDLLPQGYYTFGADGKMVNPPAAE